MSQEKKTFTHFDDQGNAVMVDIGEKKETVRVAVAGAMVTMSPECFTMVKSGSVKKGDVLGIARVAGIMAAKRVADLIPLTHPLLIDKVTVDFCYNEEDCSIEITATVGVSGKTGVEMEALTAVSVAALTVYDMCKAIDKTMVIGNIRLIRKSGGKSGVFIRQ